MSAVAEHYIGSELELFAEAENWKRYFASQLRPFIGHDVLEVGAGLGGTTALLAPGHLGRWVSLEPDAELAARIPITVRDAFPRCQVEVGTLATFAGGEVFDSVLYIDVLEHIEEDGAEARRAAARLRSGGTLIVLAPAHQWLFSPFDESIGHFRRYTRDSLASVIPTGLELVRLGYLDAVGMLASAGNRFLARSAMPNKLQIKLWDRLMVPLSRLIDPVLGYRLGKSLLGVWRKP